MFLEDLPLRQRSVKLPSLRLTFSSSSELEESSLEKSNAESSTHSGHDLLELLLFLVPEAVLLLIIALFARVIPVVVVVVVILVGGVELLPFGAVGDEVGGVTALEATPR
jgi:hypothetical protein